MVPYASVFLVDSLEETGPVLTRYSGNMVFEIYAFAGGGTLIQRMDRALQLGADIINSLTSDRSLGLAGQTDDILCSISALDGDRFGIPGAGVAFIQATVTFQSDRGV
ncbi:MAG: hypothetical protein CMO80_21945 [Verrucomicrobiales bacterium]|nr:hypothetical protein [Verrucomicrobiales bacterium]